ISFEVYIFPSTCVTFLFFFSSRRRHTRSKRDWSSDVCSSDLTLVNEILYTALSRRVHRARAIPGQHRSISGADDIDKVIHVDQSPIGRTPRSNPATYTGVFDHVRKLFAQTPEAKIGRAHV